MEGSVWKAIRGRYKVKQGERGKKYTFLGEGWEKTSWRENLDWVQEQIGWQEKKTIQAQGRASLRHKSHKDLSRRGRCLIGLHLNWDVSIHSLRHSSTLGNETAISMRTAFMEIRLTSWAFFSNKKIWRQEAQHCLCLNIQFGRVSAVKPLLCWY